MGITYMFAFEFIQKAEIILYLFTEASVLCQGPV